MNENKTLFLEKVKVGLLLAIAVLLLAFVVMMGVAVHSLSRYGAQVGNIVSGLERITQDLDALDVDSLVQTVNDVSQALDSEKVDQIVTSLESISAQLAEIDLTAMGENVNGLLVQAQSSLANAEDALVKATGTLDAIDIEALNSAITDLKAVIEPLAKFADRFG